jgi:hypothetical protein
MTTLLTTIALATALMSADTETTYRMIADPIVVTAETAAPADEITTTTAASSEEAHKVYEEAIEQQKAEESGSIVDARSPKARTIYQESVKQSKAPAKNQITIIGGARQVHQTHTKALKYIQ